jgi:hypothetical protein
MKAMNIGIWNLSHLKDKGTIGVEMSEYVKDWVHPSGKLDLIKDCMV